MVDKFLVLLCACGCALAIDTGFPAGYMGDYGNYWDSDEHSYVYLKACPGMYNHTQFSDSTKRSLSVVVMWPTNGFIRSQETKCQLSVRGAACAARHLNLKKKKTQVMISGYLDASFSPVVRSVVAPYLAMGRNIIVVEIFPLLFRPYPMAARITRPLGEILGEFLAELTRRGLPPSRLELTGGSLGAHIAYYAAAKYRELTGRKPARLSGLDPAGPCFRNLPPSQRFNPEGAERVDALHTNIDGFGIADPIGHIDFYANGGEYQPSMAGNFIMPCFLVCSHLRSAFYWMLAFENPDKFIAVRCESVAKARHGDCYNDPVVSNFLGPKTNFTNKGIYYLPTKERIPYYIGEEGLKKRKYNHNNFLLRVSPENDVIV